MKKLIVAAILLVGLSTFAQEQPKNTRREKSEQMTPEQKSVLRLKKLTLDLSLNTSQQKEMSKIVTEMETKRETSKAERLANNEAKTKPTKDELFAMQTKHLDEQIATKERVKKILDANQFQKWEKMQDKRKEKMTKYKRDRKGKGAIEK